MQNILAPQLPLVNAVHSLRLALGEWQDAYASYAKLFPLPRNAPYCARAADETGADYGRRVLTELARLYPAILAEDVELALARGEAGWKRQQDEELAGKHAELAAARAAAAGEVAAFKTEHAAALAPVAAPVLDNIAAQRARLAELGCRRSALAGKVAAVRAETEDAVRRTADRRIGATPEGARLFARIERAKALIGQMRGRLEADRQAQEKWRQRILQLRGERRRQRGAHEEAVRHGRARVERVARAARLLVEHFAAVAPPGRPLPRDGPAMRDLCDAALARMRAAKSR
jgi:hypothetical protein